MDKSIFKKLIISLMMSILIIGIFCPQSSYAIGNIISDGKNFLEQGESPYDRIDRDSLESTSNDIYNVLLAFAIVIAVIVAMILGIQFMWASADEKAKVKESLMPFIVGCIVVFGSFTIWKVAVNIGNEAEGEIKLQSTGTPIVDSIVDSIVWNYEGDAVQYLEEGKSLTEVPNNTLYSWYGQLARAATGNRPRHQEQYEKVKTECKARGFWGEDDTIRDEVTQRTDVYYYEE